MAAKKTTKKTAKKAAKKAAKAADNLDDIFIDDDDFQEHAPVDEEPVPVGGPDEFTGLPKEGWSETSPEVAEEPVEAPPEIKAESIDEDSASNLSEVEEPPIDYDHTMKSFRECRMAIRWLLNKSKGVSPKDRAIIANCDRRAEAEIAALNEAKNKTQ